MLSWSSPTRLAPFVSRMPMIAEGDVVDADRLAQRIGRLEELLDDRLADHADLGGGGDVALGEEAARGAAASCAR